MKFFGKKNKNNNDNDEMKNDGSSVPPMEWKSSDPEMEAGFVSAVLFMWLQPLFTRASFLHKRGMALEQVDLTPLPAIDHSKSIEDRFEEAYNAYELKQQQQKKQTKKKKKQPKGTKGVIVSTTSDANHDDIPKEIDGIQKETDGVFTNTNNPDGVFTTAADAKKEVEDRMIHSLLAVCKQRLITAGIIKFFNTCLQFTFPLLLNAILKYFEDYQAGKIPVDSPDQYRGYWLSALLLFFIGAKALTEAAYFHKVNRCSWQIKAAVSSAVYRKSLKLASSAQHQTTLGEMVNLMQVDATKMEAFVPQIHVLWDGLLQVAGYMTILGTLLGWPCVIGLALMMFAGPTMGVIMGRLFGINREMVKYTDDRVKTVNEALQGIRCVKMYTWEESFAKEVGTSRQSELDCLKRVAILRGFSRAYMMALPTLAATVTFLVYTFATDRAISASTLFAAIIAFDQLRFPLMFYPMAVAQYAQAKVSSGRVATFLGYKEVTEEGYERREAVDGNGAIDIQNTTIFWSDPDTPMTKAEMDDKGLDKSNHTDDYSNVSKEDLIYPKAIVSDVSLHVAPKELCAVVGRVGSGKSTLCAAILNETVLGEGSQIALTGRVAYVAQSAWIMNRNVRDNILFGLPYDEERYKKVVEVCQLTHDLEMLDDGDMTEIGEKGINLSGGQKQRVSVARAAYADADVVIFDDPLSALDPEVAMKLFDECIAGFLKDKTILLVTNQLQCLPKCDSIIALGKGGRVVEQGTYSDLMNAQDGEVYRLLKDLEEAAKKQAEDSELNEEEKLSLAGKAPTQQVARELSAAPEAKEKGSTPQSLVTQEEREVGAVKSEVYFKYIRAGGGWLNLSFVIFFFVLSASVNLATGVWISLWTSDTSYEKNSEGFYIGGYALFAVLVGFFTFCRSYLLAIFGVKASSALHSGLLKSILRAPMSFFDTTPTGRILSRFSKDMHTIDQELADFLDFVIFMGLSLCVTLATIVFATPWFGIALIPLGFVYIKILNYFRDVSRETKRLESLSRSPVYAHFSETLGGLSTIRAYGESGSFVQDFEVKLDGSTTAIYSNKSSERWLSARLELIGAFIAGLAAVFSTQVVVSNGASGIGEDNDTFASLAGLSLTYAIQVTGMLQWVVRSFAQVEAAMNSAERVLYYSEKIPREAAMDSDELQSDADTEPLLNSATQAIISTGGKAIHPTKEWPQSGAIVMNNLQMRYRPETPLVLKGLNVTIGGGERVGVVGRTGSGKSSLLLCLMRIVEPELAEDNIDEKYVSPLTIDGVDVLRVGLADLRTKLGIIPQNPVLFSGSIRSNMDPFNDYTDDAIWDALGKCGMHQAVTEMSDGLVSPVAEYGENLSQGQRQLLCLGRALLKQCRILLLDEATSSVDYETDQEIQHTIREAFVGSTVLTIAHRVNTIMDSDKILVMKDGRASEFAPPKELLNDENSLFSEIVRHSQAENEQ